MFEMIESNLHWKYFLALDDDFSALSRYIEPCNENMGVFSLELARLLMVATQECDVVLKELCIKSGNTSAANEQGYRSHLISVYPSISSFKIVCTRHNLEFTPFSSWRNNQTPAWWTANNKVKHQRNAHFSEGNLRNTMESICGLFVLNLYLHRDEDSLIFLMPEPRCFRPKLRFKCSRCIVQLQYIVPD